MPTGGEEALNLRFLEYYTDSLASLVDGSDDGLSLGDLELADIVVADNFLRYIRDEAEESPTFVARYPDGRLIAALTPGYALLGDNSSEPLVERAREALTTLGFGIATSDALTRHAFPEAYRMIRRTLHRFDQRYDTGPDFVKIAYNRMHNDLYDAYRKSRLGYRLYPPSPDKLEANIREAWRITGYRAGLLGGLALRLDRYRQRGTLNR